MNSANNANNAAAQETGRGNLTLEAAPAVVADILPRAPARGVA